MNPFIMKYKTISLSVFAPKSDQVLDQSGAEPMNLFMVKYSLIYLPVFAVSANKLLRQSEA